MPVMKILKFANRCDRLFIHISNQKYKPIFDHGGLIQLQNCAALHFILFPPSRAPFLWRQSDGFNAAVCPRLSAALAKAQ